MTNTQYTTKFIRELQTHQTRVSVTISAVRSQGAGTGARARKFFAKEFNLGKLRVGSQAAYQRRLDVETEALRRRLRGKGKSWGLARKLCNIFIRDCVYSRILCAHYKLESIEGFLEIPLDGIVGKRLILEAKSSGYEPRLPRWDSIRRLKESNSKQFQNFASVFARESGLARVHLDVRMWGNR